MPYSPATGLPIESQTVSQMVDRVMEIPDGTRLYLLAPIARGRKGEYKKELAELMKKGFQRAKIDGTIYEIPDAPKLDKKFKHDIDVVVDRIVLPKSGDTKARADIKKRLADSFETALGLADGIVFAEFADKPLSKADTEGANKSKNETHERLTFSARFACPVSGFTIEEIEPRLFSFNAPAGACPECDGLGTELQFEPDLVVPDAELSLKDGAIYPWSRTGNTSPYYEQTLEALAKHYKVSMTIPWERLPKHVQLAILYGTGEEEVEFTYEDGHRKYKTDEDLRRRHRQHRTPLARNGFSEWVREELSRYQGAHACEACKGYRLKPQALAVKVGGKHIGEVGDLSIKKANEWFAEVPKTFTKQQTEIATRILKEIRERLAFLNDVGLEYLTLSRAAGTLSGGESQRIRLASQIGSGLTGVLYVLDEPSIGLHQRDNDRLLATLRHLRDLGNTVIVVEHDEDAILTADYVVDIGPGAGIHGGEVIAQGSPDDIMADPEEHHRPVPLRRAPDPAAEGAPQAAEGPRPQGHRRPRQQPAQPHGRNPARPLHLHHRRLRRRQVHAADRHRSSRPSPASSTTRASTPRPSTSSTASKTSTRSSTSTSRPSAARRARTPRPTPAPSRRSATGSRASRNARRAATARAASRSTSKAAAAKPAKATACSRSRCTSCPTSTSPATMCKGKRYNRETLEVTFRDKSIADVLDMTVEEGAEFFRAVPPIRDKLETLARVGLGYIHIGQQATTLSGGEAQRIKLSKELSRRATGRTLYILDEPTTGLHFHDVAKLLEVLHELADAGNTVVVIEHNLEVIKTADWVIDLGPEGGDGGGHIVAAGTPEHIASVKESYTGRYLKDLLVRRNKGSGNGKKQAAE